MKNIFGILFFCFTCVSISHQHGALLEPPSRNAAWLFDDDFEECCTSYDYNEQNCGGTSRQWKKNEGKCGVCGDPWDSERPYEKGGERYYGKIMRTYRQGSAINVEIILTANHKGSFEFRICNIDGSESDVTQECLNKTILKIKDTNETRYILNNEMKHSYNIQLPEHLECNHCVLQWKWIAAKDWGNDENGNSCMGCGPIQENSYNCADISIQNEFDENNLMTKTTSTSSSLEDKRQTERAEYKNSSFNTGCQTKLKFGNTLSIKTLMDIFCKNVCSEKCPDLIEDLNSNLKIGENVEPSSDLIACLDTCPLVCDC